VTQHDRARRALSRAAQIGRRAALLPLFPLAAAAAAAADASTARAQEVGYPPERSPFRDLEYRQELTAFTGYFAAGKDPVGVAPRGGPMLGARYEVRVGGPAQFTARGGVVWSKRTVIDPRLAPGSRELGTPEQGLYVADVGLSLNLTGQKSYHRVVPLIHGGIGVVSDFRGRDRGGFQFGTSFAFSYGAGVRLVGAGPFQLRADVSDMLYQIEYPDTYFTPFNSQAPVITTGRSKGAWTHNAALTIGASILLFR